LDHDILSVSLMVGVCIGSLVAAKITSFEKWTHVLLPGAAGMGISLAAAGLLVSNGDSQQFLILLALLALAGTFGGLFLIPVTSFIQIRPKADSKGRIIAVDNFLAFSCMLLAGMVFPILDNRLQPSQSMLLLGLVSILAAGVIWFALRRVVRITDEQ